MEKPGNKQGESHGAHHVTPLSVYNRVFGMLVLLTIITVGSSYMDFGNANILIAMVIATIKALMVILFFMGLKYEGMENNVTFFCSFVFLAIFVGLSSGDIFFRKDLQPALVDASDMPPSTELVDVPRLIKSTPEQVAHGKEVFTQNCITCHGGAGKGDGPAAQALTPRPRNFTSNDGWKFGRGVANMFHTVTNGSPGTGMSAFGAMKPEDRFAVVHYVRTMMADAPADKAEDVAMLQKELGTAPKPRITVEKALDKVSQEWAAGHPEK